MKKKTWLLALPMITSVLFGCKGSTENNDIVNNGENPLVAQLQALPDTCFLFGHHDDPMYGVEWAFEEGQSDVKNVCGKYPAMMTFDIGGLELDNEKNLDGVPFERMRQEIIKQHQRGGFVSLSWHLRNPKTGGDSWDVSDSTVVGTIINDSVMHQKMASWLDKVAVFLKSLKDDEGNDINIIFRPWHEHTGSWFWWGLKLCSTEEYKALWKMTAERLEQQGVKNVVYAYSPGTEPQTVEQYMERFPEGNIIKVAGFDCYHSNDSYAERLDKSLTLLDSVVQKYDLIPAVTETGYEGVKDPKWWTGTLLPTISKHKVAYVAVWRNAWDKKGHYYAPYPGHPSADDFKCFADDPRTLFVE